MLFLCVCWDHEVELEEASESTGRSRKASLASSSVGWRVLQLNYHHYYHLSRHSWRVAEEPSGAFWGSISGEGEAALGPIPQRSVVGMPQLWPTQTDASKGSMLDEQCQMTIDDNNSYLNLEKYVSIIFLLRMKYCCFFLSN